MEYAARAGSTTAFYSGEIGERGTPGACFAEPKLEPIAWYCHSAGTSTHPAGRKQPNAWGLHDMSGNAYEWVNDAFSGLGYGPGPLVDPGGEVPREALGVVRGGGFNAWSSMLRSAARLPLDRHARSPAGGFRLVRTVR